MPLSKDGRLGAITPRLRRGKRKDEEVKED
jgi:hypothetical protein